MNREPAPPQQSTPTGRTIRRQLRGKREDIADLITRQTLPADDMQPFDPFLLLNHHGPQIYPPGNRGLPFGPHPHRGFETVTFIVDGSVLHRDTGGHESAIRSGGVQWMTAGSGLEHAEESPREFLEQGGKLDILQLWVNLPARLKFTAPRYIGLQREEMPIITAADERVRVHLISGTFGGATGPVKSLTGVAMMTVELSAGGKVTLPAPRSRNVLLYVVRGTIVVAGEEVAEFRLVEMNDDGDEISIEATDDALVIFGHADPLGEPVASHGPFVMNTREEILQAIRDYQSGKFAGKVRL